MWPPTKTNECPLKRGHVQRKFHLPTIALEGICSLVFEEAALLLLLCLTIPDSNSSLRPPPLAPSSSNWYTSSIWTIGPHVHPPEWRVGVITESNHLSVQKGFLEAMFPIRHLKSMIPALKNYSLAKAWALGFRKKTLFGLPRTK